MLMPIWLPTQCECGCVTLRSHLLFDLSMTSVLTHSGHTHTFSSGRHSTGEKWKLIMCYNICIMENIWSFTQDSVTSPSHMLLDLDMTFGLPNSEPYSVETQLPPAPCSQTLYLNIIVNSAPLGWTPCNRWSQVTHPLYWNIYMQKGPY